MTDCRKRTKYDHWFWNSKFAYWVMSKSTRFNNWLWYKMYKRK